ncbi:unnamed protein product [Prorocentrum cordatum]|uniref:Receptor ligand binding region domain-containing protein n=1 Tax=Prorocentrum cordatum TaxID=2364126 RepID=A0ABN9QHB2_9DINO|nr:unnamed protein product [Polarella glacialis]
MGFAAWRLFVACTATKFATADASDGSWRKEYPPWGEIGVPTEGAPVVWLPLIGPFTNHGCFPSRYMSMRIAVSHVNRRDGTFCPAIASLASDFELQYGIKDTGSSGIGAASAVLDFFSNSTVKSMIKVFLGPNGSGASKASSTILSVFGIPQISWASTNADLSNKVQFPQYFRTVSPDSLVMKVLSGLISSLGFTSVNVLYFDAPFQSGQAADFTSSAESEFGMQVTKYSIPNSGEGGVAVSDRNRPMMNKALEAVRVSDCRVVVAFCIYEEAWDLFSAAFDYDLVNGDGWVWFGADGLAGNQLIGDVTRVYAFVGAIYVAASSQGPRFEDYVAKWAEDMPSTLTPEFSEMDLCLDHRRSGSPPAVCDGNPEFKGQMGPRRPQRDPALQGLHRAGIRRGGHAGGRRRQAPREARGAPGRAHPRGPDWLSEMRRLSEPNQSFDCLSGELTYNEDQEPHPAHGLLQLAERVTRGEPRGPVEPHQRLRLADRAGEIQWPGGARAVIQDAAHPPSLPSGALPECGADEYYSTAEQQCTPECLAGEEPDEAGACRACAAGTFKPSAGQRACQNCTAGRVAAASGSRLCSECGPGTFQGAEGQEESARSAPRAPSRPRRRAPRASPAPRGPAPPRRGRRAASRASWGTTRRLPPWAFRVHQVPRGHHLGVDPGGGQAPVGAGGGRGGAVRLRLRGGHQESDGGGGCVSCGTKETTGVI